MTKPGKFLKHPSVHYANMADNPLDIRPDEPTIPSVFKGEHKLFTEEFARVQNGWNDKSLSQLNHCEWGQVASMRLLKRLELKYQADPEVCADLVTLGKTMDLTGANISRAQESAASLRTNAILQQRDSFLSKIDKDVPGQLIKKARVQPVFDTKHLTGDVTLEMAQSISVTGPTFAASMIRELVRPVARKDNRRQDRAPTHSSRGGRSGRDSRRSRDNRSQNYNYQKPKPQNQPGNGRSRSPDQKQNSGRGFGRKSRPGKGRPFDKKQ